ncbi:MAG: alkaline phosphatase family protein [Desulfobulbaceae bacterium]|nr:alkaline phosphatase family protein [Desulfobulbaceae bacterium]
MRKKRVVVIDVVGLSCSHLEQREAIPNISALSDSGISCNMKPPFPALTLPAQATLTTGLSPSQHGVVANGFYFPENFQVSFWEQACSLVQGKPVWQQIREENSDLSTALLFMQNSLFADCKVVMTPKPMHTEDGLVPWCYSKPVGFYEEVCRDIGEFPLYHYWGPRAGIESSRWIADAALKTLEIHGPDLMFVYLPHLDYSCQKFGPGSSEVMAELTRIDHEVGRIVAGVDALGLRDETVFVVLSEYAFSTVVDAVPLNRILRQHNLLHVREIRGKEYLDFELSPAFAMVDHQIAHIYIKDGFKKEVGAVLEKEDGIEMLLQGDGDKKLYNIDHGRAGDIIAVSKRDRWFSYYWWLDDRYAPDFSGKVDIHRKPGYDPLELFFDPETRKIPQDTKLIRGSHGYPPRAEEDFVPLIINGKLPDELFETGIVSMEDVAGFIKKIL